MELSVPRTMLRTVPSVVSDISLTRIKLSVVRHERAFSNTKVDYFSEGFSRVTLKTKLKLIAG